MTKTSLALLLALAAAPAAAADFIDGIAQRSCSCLEETLPKTPRRREAINMQAGACMLKSITPDDRAKLKKQYGIDFGDLNTSGERLGELVGARMALHCSDVMVKVANASDEPDAETLSGEVVSVDDGGFVVVTVKDESGKATRLLWLHAVKSNRDLPGAYRALVGRRVEATFEQAELFDPKIGEYRSYRVLKTLDVL